MTMKCVFCGKVDMLRDTRDVSYTYKGQTTTIPNVSGEFCAACDESLHNAEEAEYLNAEMLAFTKKVNGATVDPGFISNTRKKLKLDQREAAEIFGGGPNAFSRYENGKTRPPLSLVQLFKLLDKHPELLDEIREKKNPQASTNETPPARIARRKRIYA